MAVVKLPVSRFIKGHKAVRDALRDTQTYSSDLQGDSDVRTYRQLPLEVDPPRHHLYRSALAPIFVKPAIEKCEAAFAQSTKRLLTEFLKDPSRDVIPHLALPIVMHNLGILYGREKDVTEWISWGPDVWTATGPERDGSVLHAYIDRVYEESMSIESGDVWHRIAHMEIEGRQVSAIEFRGIVSVMLAGGRDTMVKMIAGILLHLGNNPADKEMLIAEPALIDSAVQEFLRYLTPIPWMGRTTVPETGATNLPDDRYVNISFVSGNFDPEVFPDPTTINLRRERNAHVAFGFGPHTCIGNHLAEFEVRVFLQVLLAMNIKWSISPDTAIMTYPDELSTVHLVIEKLYISL